MNNTGPYKFDFTDQKNQEKIKSFSYMTKEKNKDIIT